MKARGLIFDLFGCYLLNRGGEVRLRTLITLMNCFAVPEPTVRVVVARLRKEGWLASRRTGRETSYYLTEAALRLIGAGQSRIFSRCGRSWDRQWHMVIYSVPETERGLREQLRKKLCWLGFGPLSSSVWVSSHDRVDAVKASFADRPEIQLDTFRARSKGLEADRDIAARCWDLDAVNKDYADLVVRYQPRLPHYRASGPTGSAALVERVTLLHEYRAFPHRDPDLPPELLPPDWWGTQAHELFLEAHELLRKPAEEFVDEVLASSNGGAPLRGEPAAGELARVGAG